MKLIVMDMQKGILNDELYNCSGVLENVKKLIETARKNGTEVIYVQHDDGEGSGFTSGDTDFEIADEIAPKDGEKSFVKTSCSAFTNKDFERYLKDSGDEILMIVGLMTNFCVDATVKSADERDYGIIVPKGANSTVDNDYMDGKTTCEYYLNEVWQGAFADCVSMDDAIDIIEKL